MGKRVTPLRAGRGSRQGQAHGSADLRILAQERALRAYPFADISENLEVSISPRAKRMALRLNHRDRIVHLVVPKRASLRSAYDFAQDHQNWIQEKISKLPKIVPFQDGKTLPVFGRDRRIIVLYNKALRKTDIQLKKNEIIVITNKKDPAGRIRRFLMEQARKKISLLAQEKADRLDKKIAHLSVRDTVSRWGSCSEDGRLSFSWRLIFAPPEAMDYVVAHEVAHLVYMDHSRNFWAVCEELCDDYAQGKGWMHTNGHDLMRFGIES
ncbi:MAG: M48 family metallopeptidase [Rhodospirillales bacterium]|nr:M48 family metallopeptidase [Alphaproteobacteria bacterium]USO03258.1 MAG: M48 family metallopeptidase [Rhodospirillales bacterium]